MDKAPPIICKSSDWLAARAGDEVMMMSAAQGLYLGLNAMGARIWGLLDTLDNVDAICARLQEEFAVSAEVCRDEVERFLAELAEHRAIAIVTPPEG